MELISAHRTSAREYVGGETDSFIRNSNLRLKHVLIVRNGSLTRMCV